MEGDFESDHQQLLSRREQLRAQRQAAHSAPARVRLRLGAVILIVAAMLSWLLVSWLGSGTSAGEALPEPPPLEHSTDRPVEHPEPGQQAGGTGPEETDAAPVVVHVAGAVRDPQVVELKAGARAAEAVEAAGGLSPDAAAQGLNLAAQVTDGSFIWVPTVDELDEGDTGPPAAAPGAGQPYETGQAGEDAPININTAAAEQLEELTGIGPALAERIITYRESNGGFSSLDELAAVSGIGPSILENIVDDVDW